MSHKLRTTYQGKDMLKNKVSELDFHFEKASIILYSNSITNANITGAMLKFC